MFTAATNRVGGRTILGESEFIERVADDLPLLDLCTYFVFFLQIETLHLNVT